VIKLYLLQVPAFYGVIVLLTQKAAVNSISANPHNAGSQYTSTLTTSQCILPAERQVMSGCNAAKKHCADDSI